MTQKFTDQIARNYQELRENVKNCLKVGSFWQRLAKNRHQRLKLERRIGTSAKKRILIKLRIWNPSDIVLIIQKVRIDTYKGN